MDWLTICRRIRKECGLSGADTSPMSVAGQTGEMLAVVNWCASAWAAIEGRRLWDWQWERPTLTLLATEDTIAAATAGQVSAHRYVIDTMWAGTARMTYVPWTEFRRAWPPALIGDGDPSYWSVRPDRALAFSSKPTSNLSLTVERYRNPVAVGDDDDEPLMPEHLHEAIVWRAVMFYAGHDEAGDLYRHALAEYRRVMGQAAQDDLPDLFDGAPLC